MKKNDKKTKTAERAAAILKDKQLAETTGGLNGKGCPTCGIMNSHDDIWASRAGDGAGAPFSPSVRACMRARRGVAMPPRVGISMCSTEPFRDAILPLVEDGLIDAIEREIDHVFVGGTGDNPQPRWA